MSQAVRRVECQGVAEPAGASWSNALLIGREVVMSGMTAHPASREANLDCYAQTLVVLGKIQALVTAAGGHIGNIHRLTVYLTDIADKDQVGRARRDFSPARQCFPRRPWWPSARWCFLNYGSRSRPAPGSMSTCVPSQR